MRRISSQMSNNDMQYWSRLREADLNRMQNKIAGQTRIKNLRDDPISAAHSSRYNSFVTRLRRFSENASFLQSNHRITEGHVRESVDILHRVRELGVQAANGTFSKDDLTFMAREVDELLKQLIQTANAVNGDGTAVFAGDKNRMPPFRTIEGRVPGAPDAVVTSVEYLGTIKENHAEVSDGAYMRINYAGNRVFWAENQQIFSDRDALDYQVRSDSPIFIDGVRIDLRAGDNIFAIMSRINQSDAPVRARLDPLRNSLVLETTSPRQLWLQDEAGSTVLQDLGILRDNESAPPHNLAPTARSFGGSVFDMVIRLRDQMFTGDTEEIGGLGLRGIDSAMSGLLSNLGDIGAQGKRIEIAMERLSMTKVDMIEMNSREVDIDMAEAITELKMLEHVHQAALGTAGRILQPTLLDFLR